MKAGEKLLASQGSPPARRLPAGLVTRDPLGDRVRDDELHGGHDVGKADAGVDVTFDFGIAHLARKKILDARRHSIFGAIEQTVAAT